MLGNLFGKGCGCERGGRKICLPFGTNSSCDVLWIIILLMVVFNGGIFGLDICTLIILFVVFGGKLFGCKEEKHECRPC